MPPKHHHGPHIQYEGEARERSLAQISERLRKIGDLLGSQGFLKLNQTTVKPTDPCMLIVKYERLARGELSLKIELLWDERPVEDESDPGGEIAIS